MGTQTFEIGNNGLQQIKEEYTNLKRGDIIRWGGNMGYPSENLVVLEKLKGWEDKTVYKVVNIKRSYQPQNEYCPHIKQINAGSIKNPKDKSLWHTQHDYITNQTLSETQIKKIIDFVPIAKSRDLQAEQDRIKAIKDAGQLTKSEKISYSVTDINKTVRQKLKNEFPNCTFSLKKNHCNSITLTLKKANFKVFRDYSELSEACILKYKDGGLRSETQLREMCKETYAQLNQYAFNDDYDSEVWNNGSFLTRKAHEVLKKAVGFLNYYNYDDSDVQTDYFSVNFYLSVQIDLKNGGTKRNC